MDHLFSFEKLDVYQLSRKFVKKIYEISNHFPDEEKFGITSQMRRAAVSVLANMAEGSAREGGKAQAMFTTYSIPA